MVRSLYRRSATVDDSHTDTTVEYVVSFHSSAKNDIDEEQGCAKFKTVCRGRMITRIFTLTWEKELVISCAALLLDPLFFYIPTIDEKKKCIAMDNKLMISILVLRLLTDLIFIFRIASRFRAQRDRIRLSWSLLFKGIKSDSALDLLAILPVQQVAIIIVFFRLGSSGYQYKTAIVNFFFLLQLVFRAYHISYSSKLSSKLERYDNYVKCALNFFLYLLAGHVIGAFWYFFSIQRGASCWHQVCTNTAGCITTYYCEHTTTSPSVIILDDLCPISTENANVFDFGIFLNAFQSGTIGSIDFPTKILYTFWWGFRNLSNFGTNLETSSYALENLFTILIAVIGWLLFLYLIGNLQSYILDEKVKLLSTSKAIDSWMSIHLSGDDKLIKLKKEIKEYIVEKNFSTNGDIDIDVNVKFFITILDKDKATRLRKHLCTHALKKELRRRRMSKFLSAVVEDLEPVVYEKNSLVFGTREPLDTMLFILDGVIGAIDGGMNAGVPSRISKSEYKKGDIFGKDMFSLQSDSDLPASIRDFKCVTKVEAFALTYEKWRSILNDIDRHRSEKLVIYSKTEEILLNKAYRKMTTTRWGKIEREIGLRMRLMKCDMVENMKNAISCKEIDILDWLSRNGFSDDAKTTIITRVRVKDIVKRTLNVDVDVKYLLSQPIGDLPGDMQKSIRKQLALKPLKKVPMLEKLDENVLSILCEEYLQPEIYSEEKYLVRAGEPIGLMFIIIEGTVIAGSRRFVKGDFYGEPLLSWASPNNLFSGPAPISTEDVICYTKVEALALKASQFRSLVADFSSQWISNFNMCGDSQQFDENLAFPYEFNSQRISKFNMFDPKNNMCGNSQQQLDEDLAFPYDKIDEELKETFMQLEFKDVEEIEDQVLRQKIKIMKKEDEILGWVSSIGHSEDITTQIKRSIKISKVVEENIDVDVNLKNILPILPSNIKQSLKEYICMGALKKVPILENVDEDLLNRICLNLEPEIHPQNYVIKAGEELDRMIIIVKGEVKCTATSNDSVTPVPTTQQFLETGDLFGEELLTLAFPDIFSPPVFNQDFLCQTKVEALALTAKGLDSVFSYYRDRLYRSDE